METELPPFVKRHSVREKFENMVESENAKMKGKSPPPTTGIAGSGGGGSSSDHHQGRQQESSPDVRQLPPQLRSRLAAEKVWSFACLLRGKAQATKSLTTEQITASTLLTNDAILEWLSKLKFEEFGFKRQINSLDAVQVLESFNTVVQSIEKFVVDINKGDLIQTSVRKAGEWWEQASRLSSDLETKESPNINPHIRAIKEVLAQLRDTLAVIIRMAITVPNFFSLVDDMLGWIHNLFRLYFLESEEGGGEDADNQGASSSFKPSSSTTDAANTSSGQRKVSNDQFISKVKEPLKRAADYTIYGGHQQPSREEQEEASGNEKFAYSQSSAKDALKKSLISIVSECRSDPKSAEALRFLSRAMQLLYHHITAAVKSSRIRNDKYNDFTECVLELLRRLSSTSLSPVNKFVDSGYTLVSELPYDEALQKWFDDINKLLNPASSSSSSRSSPPASSPSPHPGGDKGDNKGKAKSRDQQEQQSPSTTATSEEEKLVMEIINDTISIFKNTKQLQAFIKFREDAKQLIEACNCNPVIVQLRNSFRSFYQNLLVLDENDNPRPDQAVRQRDMYYDIAKAAVGPFLSSIKYVPLPRMVHIDQYTQIAVDMATADISGILPNNIQVVTTADFSLGGTIGNISFNNDHPPNISGSGSTSSNSSSSISSSSNTDGGGGIDSKAVGGGGGVLTKIKKSAKNKRKRSKTSSSDKQRLLKGSSPSNNHNNNNNVDSKNSDTELTLNISLKNLNTSITDAIYYYNRTKGLCKWFSDTGTVSIICPNRGIDISIQLLLLPNKKLFSISPSSLTKQQKQQQPSSVGNAKKSEQITASLNRLRCWLLSCHLLDIDIQINDLDIKLNSHAKPNLLYTVLKPRVKKRLKQEIAFGIRKNLTDFFGTLNDIIYSQSFYITHEGGSDGGEGDYNGDSIGGNGQEGGNSQVVLPRGGGNDDDDDAVGRRRRSPDKGREDKDTPMRQHSVHSRDLAPKDSDDNDHDVEDFIRFSPPGSSWPNNKKEREGDEAAKHNNNNNSVAVVGNSNNKRNTDMQVTQSGGGGSANDAQNRNTGRNNDDNHKEEVEGHGNGEDGNVGATTTTTAAAAGTSPSSTSLPKQKANIMRRDNNNKTSESPSFKNGHVGVGDEVWEEIEAKNGAKSS
ncbi:hypothetical protein H4219_004349 [Mycoemilia scoparia]|uniref:Uncharacterized protein n=1 Tax=Mycoemilia scoparia TaxID=417184 RepID=A0A9W7ZRZ1_9FUNG|nr:hypothetical protein H4219_004349 [Mycoemilia scoparia]